MGHHYWTSPWKRNCCWVRNCWLITKKRTTSASPGTVSDDRDPQLPVVKRGDKIEITIRDRNRKKRSSGPNDDVILLANDEEEVLAELFLGSRLVTQSNCDAFMAGICPARFQPVRRIRSRQHRPRRRVISAPCRQEILHRAGRLPKRPPHAR
jgi:hypothetical protein